MPGADTPRSCRSRVVADGWAGSRPASPQWTPATLTRGLDLDIVSGRLADLQPGAMAVSRDVARAHAWSVGSTVSVQLERGSSELRVAAVYDTVTDVGGVPLGDITIGDHLLATEDFQRLSGNRRAAWIYVTAADDVAADRARAVIEQAADAGSKLVIRDRPALRRELLGQLNDAAQVYGALLGLVILVSLFGVANTMSLSVIERTRELGLLRSVGMDRTQIRAMIRWEAIVVTGIGAVAGVGLGIIYGRAVVRAFSQSGVDVFRPPIGHLSLAIVLMALTGVAAAALPARRAGRIIVLDAIATE